MTGGLFDPLGTGPGPARRAGPRPSAPVVAAALVLAALAALVAASWLRDDGDRGRPVAVAPIEHAQAPPKPAAPEAVPPAAPAAPPPATAPPPAAGLPPPRDDQEVEIQNGVRIVRPRRAPAQSGGQTVPVPGSGAVR